MNPLLQSCLNSVQTESVRGAISAELTFLFYSFILGAVITFFYDNIRTLRNIIRHHSLLVSFEDLLFWVIVTFSIFTLQYYINDGMFRWFSICGALGGMIGYKITLGQIYVNIMTAILKFILKWLFYLFSFLLRPVFCLQNAAIHQAGRIGRKMKKTGRYMKNRLTEQTKLIKITLCKRGNKTKPHGK